MATAQVFVEEWAASYGSPYLVHSDDVGGVGELVEDGPTTLAVHTPPGGDEVRRLAFVDGVRRGESTLYLTDPVRGVARGVTGAHGRGAVLVAEHGRPAFAHCEIERLAIFGSGLVAELPSVTGGWKWTSRSIASPEPDAPLAELQTRMRGAEGRLAESLCEDGWLTIVDGPLSFVWSRDQPVVGYIKTHHRPLLAPEHHLRVPEIGAGERTSLFSTRGNVYSTYMRLTARSPDVGPWAGIVRLELPASLGIGEAAAMAGRLAAILPRFAGIAHIDPRAPQNLQPVGALERELRHRLGPADPASRAVRQSVRLIKLATEV